MLSTLGGIRIATDQSQHERNGCAQGVSSGFGIAIPALRVTLETRKHVQELTRRSSGRDHAHACPPAECLQLGFGDSPRVQALLALMSELGRDAFRTARVSRRREAVDPR